LIARVPGARLQVEIDALAWSEVELAQDASGAARVAVMPVGADARFRRASRDAAPGRTCPLQGGELRIGLGFNGRIGGLTLWENDALAAAWDFSAAMMTQRVPGVGPKASPLLLRQAPRRAVTGARWTGAAHDWRARPDHYDAIHFHQDDIADCGWAPSMTLNLPRACESGVYAVRLMQAGEARYAPFFVRPQRPRRLAFLASTFSYLAYGNSLWASPSAAALEAQFPRDTGFMRRFGLSTYSRHCDGSGVSLVSTRRPILNCKPGFCGDVVGGQVLLNDDLRIIEWLDTLGEPYDVVTDHDLHARGDAALAGCDVLVTGAHPEYHSVETLGAVEAFQQRGGRHCVLHLWCQPG
jgi:N,N-dimethylformamidase